MSHLLRYTDFPDEPAEFESLEEELTAALQDARDALIVPDTDDEKERCKLLLQAQANALTIIDAALAAALE